jgi:hypothetical protein
MPLKTNVGVSRKVADQNYGSRGASVNLEVELDSTLINEPDRFHDRIRQVFRLAQSAIDEELIRQQAGDNNQANGNGRASQPTQNGSNGRTNGYANGNGPAKTNGRKATASQVRALHAIAHRQGLDLALTLQERFGIDHPEDLAIGQASELIDQLKGANAGGRR